MKLVHRLLNSDLFRFLTAVGLGWIVHDPYQTEPPRQPYPRGHNLPWWGKAVYAAGLVCSLAGFLLNFSGSLTAGSWLIGIGVAMIVSNAIRLGHLKVW